MKRRPFSDLTAFLISEWLHQTGFTAGMLLRARLAEVALSSPSIAPLIFGISDGIGASSTVHGTREDAGAAPKDTN